MSYFSEHKDYMLGKNGHDLYMYKSDNFGIIYSAWIDTTPENHSLLLLKGNHKVAYSTKMNDTLGYMLDFGAMWVREGICDRQYLFPPSRLQHVPKIDEIAHAQDLALMNRPRYV